jgi:tetratricopeptide (TPR) repeat protein
MPGWALAQETTDPAYETLARAYSALQARGYDAAIELFRRAAALEPGRADIRKNLAYTLLKTGETEAAREEFGEAMRIDAGDDHVALEYAFLCYEARENAPARKAEARRIFDRIRRDGGGETRATAEQAFHNVDEPLEKGIARWKEVLAASTPSFSAYYELAQLAEQRDEGELAAANYRAAFRLQTERKSVLLELARVEKTRGNPEGMMAALLAASRGGEPRAAELAREQLPERYPYVYEFRQALELDPKSEELHRELAYLLLRMSEGGAAARAGAEEEFRAMTESSPDDYLAIAQLGLLYREDGDKARAMPYLQGVLEKGDAATANRVRIALKMPLVLEERQTATEPLDPRVLGERSYEAGFLKDAKKYFQQAHEQNPVDSSVMLKLGWTNNLLHDDQAAERWFGLARGSSDPVISGEAAKAYENLRPGVEAFRTTVWLAPAYSSRWNDLFGYGQVKTEFKVKTALFPGWLHPYASVRLVGDARVESSGANPQALSESAFIFGVGMATRQWHGATAWGEAGTSVSYLHGGGTADYRGGVSYARTRGASIAAEHGGWFFETLADSVFVSRFDNDWLNYSQSKTGITSEVAGVKMQVFWANNITFDVKRQYWANFVESGPGVRFHPPHTPAAATVTVSMIHGVYLVNAGNPRGPNYNDLRIGVWYAFTH